MPTALDTARARNAAPIEPLSASWQPVPLEPVLAGAYAAPVPTLLRTRDATRAYLYRGNVNGLHGDSGTGKSWVALAAVAQVLEAGRRAIVLDFESSAPELVSRLRAMAVAPAAIAERLNYLAPSDEVSDQAVAAVLALIQPDTDLVVIDSLGEAFGIDGIDENSDADVGPWLRRVPRRIADAGPAVLIIDHATKAGDNPLHPSGSKRKRAAFGGASYQVKASLPPTRERPGVLHLICGKDRHGHFARGEHVATVDVTPYPDGGVTVHLHEPPLKAPDSPDAMVQTIARAVVKLVRDEGRPMSRNEIEKRVNASAQGTTKRAAIDFAVGRGALAEAPGPRNARLLSYVTELDTEADS